MSGEIPERAVCEVCGTSFDPHESRGWCPNEACGKWQHPAFPLSEGGGREAADGGVNAPTKVCPSCGKDVRADANFCKFCSHEFPDEPAEPQGGDDEPGLDACPDCGADLSSIPPDRLADCPICGTDLSDVLADQSEPEVTPADLTDCPACSADLTNIPADMRMVCPDCRVDLQEAIRTHGVGDDGGADAETGAQQAGSGAGTQQAGGGQAGGAGGSAQTGGAGAGQAGGGGGAASDTGGEPDAAAESVDTIKGIGASYADRLADAGVETVGDLVRSDLAELSAATDISEKRLGEWAERAPVDPADLGGGQGGSQQPGQGGQQAGQAGSQQGQAGQQGGQQSGQAGGQQGGQGGRAGQTGGQQGGQAGGRQTGGAGQAGGQQSGQGGSQQGGQAGRGGQTGGRQGGQSGGHQGGQSGGRQGGGQTSDRQGGQAGGGQGRRASSGGGAGAGGAGGRQGGRNQPSVPGSSSGGQGGAGRAGGRQGRPSYSTVVFEVMGQEVRAAPGETVGREVRTAMVEGGAPDDDAVYVHREHLRVERESNSFYLVRLGQNSLKVNGTPVGQHERIEVSNGDEVSFSEVVTADVRLE